MYSLLLTTALAVGQAENPDRNRDRDRPTTPAPAPMQNATLDGNWTIAAFEKNGQPVTGFQNMRVTIKNNVISFSGEGVKEPAMRLEFGASGRVRLLPMDEPNRDRDRDVRPTPATPAPRTEPVPPARPNPVPPAERPNPDASTSTAAAPPPVTPPDRPRPTPDRPTTPAERPVPPDRPISPDRPATTPADRPVDRARQHDDNPHQGVYVLTKNYLALSVFEMNGRDPDRGIERPRTPDLRREPTERPRNPDSTRDPNADRERNAVPPDRTPRDRDIGRGDHPVAKITVVLRRTNPLEGNGTAPRTDR